MTSRAAGEGIGSIAATSLGVFASEAGLDDSTRLGRADYSYHFVKDYFARALSPHVAVVDIAEPGGLGRPGRLDLLFVPPHRVPAEAGAAVDVFAWEFDTIPTEAWGGEACNDWRVALHPVRGAVVHSQLAADAVRQVMPATFPVASIPAPVWDDFSPLAAASPPQRWSIQLRGWVIDSRRHGLESAAVLHGPGATVGEQSVELSGPVFTTVVNPDDARKNWVDTFSAFTEAFRDDPRVTLLVKLVHPDAARAYALVADMLFRPAPFRCRVVVVFGYLTRDSYHRLVAGSSFIVNSSRGEGQCLPLMEFMSAGVPAIAPDHSAMAQYVNVANSFIVTSSAAVTHWPHDPRLMLRCRMWVPDWDSLRDGFLAARDVLARPSDYAEMRRAATEALWNHASRERFLAAMSEFLPRVGGPPLRQETA